MKWKSVLPIVCTLFVFAVAFSATAQFDSPVIKEWTQMEKNDKVDSKNEARTTEQWNKVFGNKSKDGPVLSFGSKACVKYHSKGICYDDCFYRASHKLLGANDLKLYSDYVKKLRGE